MFSVAGQVVTALIVDAIAPADNAKLSLWVIVGTLITFVSVLIPKISEQLGKKKA